MKKEAIESAPSLKNLNTMRSNQSGYNRQGSKSPNSKFNNQKSFGGAFFDEYNQQFSHENKNDSIQGFMPLDPVATKLKDEKISSINSQGLSDNENAFDPPLIESSFKNKSSSIYDKRQSNNLFTHQGDEYINVVENHSPSDFGEMKKPRSQFQS